MKQIKTSRNQPTLDRAIGEWRESAPSSEVLSAAARQRVRDGVRAADVTHGPLAPLFLPVRRLILAGALPVLLLAVLAGLQLAPGGGGVPEADGSGFQVTVFKRGDRVVFEIANGLRTHRVYKSSDPGDFGDGPAFAEARRLFADRLDPGPGVVFYRIE